MHSIKSVKFSSVTHPSMGKLFRFQFLILCTKRLTKRNIYEEKDANKADASKSLFKKKNHYSFRVNINATLNLARKKNLSTRKCIWNAFHSRTLFGLSSVMFRRLTYVRVCIIFFSLLYRILYFVLVWLNDTSTPLLLS